MRVTLYGTRGSIPAPGPETMRYGGNTSRVDILLTHLHMDHIQGLGFFSPLYNPAVEVHLWGPASSILSLEARLSRYLSPPLFPIHLRDLPSVSCHHVPPSFDIGPFRILTALVSHPGPTVGYRIEADGGVISYLSDHEPALCRRNGRWPGREWVSGFDLAVEADLLIHDAQYTDEEYDSHVGWGHSSYRHAFEFASYVGARKLIAFHHDPDRDDEMLDHLQENAVRSIRPNFAVSGGCEGAVFDIGRGTAR